MTLEALRGTPAPLDPRIHQSARTQVRVGGSAHA